MHLCQCFSLVPCNQKRTACLWEHNTAQGTKKSCLCQFWLYSVLNVFHPSVKLTRKHVHLFFYISTQICANKSATFPNMSILYSVFKLNTPLPSAKSITACHLHIFFKKKSNCHRIFPVVKYYSKTCQWHHFINTYVCKPGNPSVLS